MNFCEILRGLRQEKGITQYEVAKNCGLTPTCICQLESGARNPTGSTVAALATFFGVSADYLLGLTSDESSQLYTLPDASTSDSYTTEERKLVEDYRSLSPNLQKMVKDTIKTFTTSEENRKRNI